MIDFEAAARDSNDPKHILPAYASGGHLNPDDAAYKAMVDSVGLKLLTQQP